MHNMHLWKVTIQRCGGVQTATAADDFNVLYRMLNSRSLLAIMSAYWSTFDQTIVFVQYTFVIQCFDKDGQFICCAIRPISWLKIRNCRKKQMLVNIYFFNVCMCSYTTLNKHLLLSIMKLFFKIEDNPDLIYIYPGELKTSHHP